MNDNLTNVEAPCYIKMKSKFYGKDEIERQQEECILREHHFRIYLNGKPYAKLICTPLQLTALVVGHLITGGLITGLEEIRDISYEKEYTECQVWLHKECQICEEIITSSENNQYLYRNNLNILPRNKEFQWKPQWIFEMAQLFQKDTELHACTHGTHSCFLAEGGRVLYVCEDIGRHNALDKAVGMGILNGVDLSKCMLFISGRVPLDMMSKVVNSGVPLIASNTIPTEQSIEMARREHVTLIGKAKVKGFCVYVDERE